MTACASCGVLIGRCSGTSSLYNPGRGVDIILCEPCWLNEDDMIEETGTNDHPDVVKRYLANIAGGGA